MEQAILNPAKYIVTDLSIDSRFADQYNSGSADFTIRLPDTYKNIMRLAVSSVEVPLVEYVFSARRQNVTFAVRISSGPVTTVTIPSGTYGAVGLAAAVQAALQAADPTGGFTCTYDPETDRFTFACSSGTFRLFLMDPATSSTGRRRYWGLGYYMGFRSQVLTGSASYTGTQPPQIGPSPYYLMQVSCPDQVETTIHVTGGQSWVPALAKIVLRGSVYSMQFDDGANRLRKEITFAGPSNVGQMRIRLVDPYGDLVDLGDVDWSMTFEITAVTSSEKYADLAGAFGRS
jgi:hypothetical protein